MPQQTDVLKTFIRSYSDNTYTRTAMVRHSGTVISFGMDNHQKIYYTVLNLGQGAAGVPSGAGNPATSPFDVDAWLPVPQELRFANEIAQVGFGVTDQTSIPVTRVGGQLAGPTVNLADSEQDHFLSSTARLTEDAPFQVLSDGTFIYVFRQAVAPTSDRMVFVDAAGNVITRQGTSLVFIDQNGTTQTVTGTPAPLVNATLLVDRFVLSGTTLEPKREVRFQRSRSKTRPQDRKDSLGANDLDGKPFLEPTQELAFVGNLQFGRFSVLLLPTQVAGVQRWQIFTLNQKTSRIDSFNLERSADGLFNTQGSQEPDSGLAEAGTALQFAAAGDLVTLTGHGVAAGATPTFELWLNLAQLPAADKALISPEGNAAGTGPSLSIVAPNKLRIAVGGKSFVTGSLLTPRQWNHIAASFDGSQFRVFLNGVLRGKGPGVAVAGPPDENVAAFGDSSGILNAEMEEVRIWSRPRGAAELAADMNRRLIGLEPGLIGYWQFDEGSGLHLFDDSNSGRNAIRGTPLFVPSDAPIRRTSGVSRKSLTTGLNVVSGFSSLLYFEQVDTPSGYSGTPKPLKQSGRVMLAFATNNSLDTTNPIAVLDFALSADGRLAELPDVVNLQTIAQPPARQTANMNAVFKDSAGLTVNGGILQFALTKDTPTLFDSSTGHIALYFRGASDEFFVAYYNTSVSPAEATLKGSDGNGSVVLRARSTQPGATDFSAAVQDGGGADLCNLVILSGSASETWRNVPRDPAALARVIGGNAGGRQFIGEATLTAGPAGAATLVLDFGAAGITRNFLEQTILRVGDLRVTVAARANLGDTTIAVQLDGTDPLPIGKLPVFAVEYDYDFLAGGLSSGSLLVFASQILSTQPVTNTTTAVEGHGSSGKWEAADPGQTPHFVNAASATLNDATQLSSLDAHGDLTIEAWVNPTGGGPDIVVHKTAASNYELRLLERDSFLNFDKEPAGFEIQPADDIDFGKDDDFTVEIWMEARFGVDSGLATGTILNKSDSSGRTPYTLEFDVASNTVTARRSDGDHNAALQFVVDSDEPHHLAFLKRGTNLELYVDGVRQVVAADPAVASTKSGASLRVGDAALAGGSPDSSKHWKGLLDEVRIWKIARTAAEIRDHQFQPLLGSEPGLVGYWHFDTLKLVETTTPHSWQAEDSTGRKHVGRLNRAADAITTAPALGISVFPLAVFGGVNGLAARSDAIVPTSQWTHVAASYSQRYGLQFDGGGYLDAGSDETLDITGDLTIEVFLQGHAGAAPANGILQRTVSAVPGKKEGVPYALSIDDEGRVIFSYQDEDGTTHDVKSDILKAEDGLYHCVAVTRSSGTQSSFDPSAVTNPNAAAGSNAKKTSEIRMFNDQTALTISSGDAGPSTAASPALQVPITKIASGKGPLEIGRRTAANPFRGFLGEVRIWNVVRPPASIGQDIQGDETGLVSWWRLTENQGFHTLDSKGGNHATIHGEAKWVNNPSFLASHLVLYVNGQPVRATFLADQPATTTGFRVGGGANSESTLEELRVWRTQRSQVQIQDNLFTRLSGEKDDLLAYYDFGVDPATGKLNDESGHGNALAMSGQFIDSTAPIGQDAPEVRSALSQLHTDFNSTLESQAGVAEYGTLETDSRGNLSGVLKRCYAFVKGGQWQLITAFKVGDLSVEWVGQVQFAPQLIGYVEGAPPVPAENLDTQSSGSLNDFSGACSVAFTETASVNFTYSSSLDTGFNLEANLKVGLATDQETILGVGVEEEAEKVTNTIGGEAHFEHSQGFLDSATTSTQRTRGRMTSLELRGRALADGSRFQPDNLGLALVQSDTADVFALRLHTGAVVSYEIRPNPDIPKDSNLISFPINPTYTKQGTLDGKVGIKDGRFQTDPDYPNALSPSSDVSYFKPIEAYSLKNRIERDEADLQTFFEQYAAGAKGRRTDSTDDFASRSSGAKLPQTIDLFKRNLVNTYVWTADGGLFAETEQTLDVVTETTGGSYHFKGTAGPTVDVRATVVEGIAVAYNLLLGGHIDLSVTKQRSATSGFQLDVHLDHVERNIFSPATNTVPAAKIPGKVDAYRFFTFYLESDSSNYDAFFAKVVDPIWLAQSDDPAAAALRQAQGDAARPPCWRILHRVTFVSRILPRVFDESAPPALEKALRTLDVDSNFELIRIMQPLVSDSLSSIGVLSQKVHDVVLANLPELAAHIPEITAFLAAYFGLSSGDGSAANAALADTPVDQLAPNQPPVVHAGADLTVGLDGNSATVKLDQATVVDDRIDSAADLFNTWKELTGPADVAFDDPHLLNPNVTFTRRGVYTLGLTSSDGALSASAGITVTVNQPPVISTAQNVAVGLHSVQALLQNPPGGDARRLKFLNDQVAANSAVRAARLIATLSDDGLGDPSQKVSLQWSVVTAAGTVTFENAQALDTLATFSDTGFYLLQIEAKNPSFSRQAQVLVSVAVRVSSGLQVLYTFKEGAGTTVHDVAAVGQPLDLTIAGSNTAFTASALQVLAPAAGTPAGLIASSDPAGRVADAVAASGEVSIEAWILPSQASQGGLARIVTVSNGAGARNFILGQSRTALHIGIRTTTSDPNAAADAFAVPLPAGATTPQHVLCTQSADGHLILYLNGAELARRTVTGALSTWDRTFRLALGNEFASDSPRRAWLGEYHLVAIYNRALTAAEVEQNFRFGADTDQPPMVSAGGDVTVNQLSLPLSGRVTQDRPSQIATGHIFWSQVDGPKTPLGVNFDDPTVPGTIAHFTQKGRYVLRLTADDGKLTAIDEITVVVNVPPSVAFTPPAPILGLDGASVALPLQAAVTDSGLGVDPSGPSPVRMQWTTLTGPSGGAVIAAPTTSTPVITFNRRGDYTFQLSVTNGPLTTTVSFPVGVFQRPVISAGADQVVALPAIALAAAGGAAGGAAVAPSPQPAIATVTGVVTDSGLPPTHAGALTTKWTRDDLRAGIASPNQLTTAVSLPESGIYTLTLRVDNGALASTSTVRLTANRPPIVEAGPGGTVALSTGTELDATVADDGLPQPVLTLKWSQVSGPAGVTFDSDSSAFTRAHFPANGQYVLQIKANDGQLDATDTVAFTVVTGPTVTITRAPDLAIARRAFNLQVAAAGGGAGGVSVTWSAVAGASAGTVTFDDPHALSTQATFSVAGNYTVQAAVTQGGVTVPQTITLNVLDLSAGDNQTLTLTGPSLAVDLHGGVTNQGVVSVGVQLGPTVVPTFQWIQVSGPVPAVLTNATTIQATATVTTRGTYVFRLVVTISQRSNQADVTVVVN